MEKSVLKLEKVRSKKMRVEGINIPVKAIPIIVIEKKHVEDYISDRVDEMMVKITEIIEKYSILSFTIHEDGKIIYIYSHDAGALSTSNCYAIKIINDKSIEYYILI